MTDHPTIFSGPMVRALLDGRKTQTRRLATSPLRQCVPGDRLWVKENHSFRGAEYGDSDGEIEWFRCYSSIGARDNWDPNFPEGWEPSQHMKVKSLSGPGGQEGAGVTGYVTKLLPSIHMPRWASRITLTVIEVRGQQLRDITEADAIAEGAPTGGFDYDGKFYERPDGSYRAGFAGLWDHLHGSGAWNENPDVVALTFAVALRNIDDTRARS